MKAGLHGSLVLSALLLAGCGPDGIVDALAQRNQVEGSFRRTLSVAAPVDLDVQTGSGEIEIREGQNGTVQIVGTIRASDRNRGNRRAEDIVRELEANPPIEQTGGSVRVGYMRGRERDYDNVSISYEILVPANTRVRAVSGSGTISVSGIDGEVDANTGSGRIDLANIHSSVKAVTGSGSIAVESVRGGLRASTGSGQIHAGGQPSGEWLISTGSGSVTVTLPPQAGFDFYAHTGSGSINIDHPLTIPGNGRRSDRRNEMSGRVRGGGFSLDVRTGSGSIRIE